RPARLLGRLAAQPRALRQPADPARRPALGPARLHPGRAARPGRPGRAAAARRARLPRLPGRLRAGAGGVSALDAEVLVVGGGPAGAAAAALLGRRGRDVLLLERSRFPREKPCGEYLSPGVLDALGRLGALAAVEALEHARPLGMRIRAGETAVELRYPDENGPRRALGVARTTFD